MIEVTILIPVADNSGDHFTPAHHAAFEAFILERFGGLSRQTQTVEGLWQDQGRTYRDTNLVYLIAIRSITDGGLLKEVTDFAKQHYRQEAIFLRYLGVAEIV